MNELSYVASLSVDEWVVDEVPEYVYPEGARVSTADLMQQGQVPA